MSIEAFLRGGGSVCPFAAGSSRIYATIGDQAPRDARSVLRAAVGQFAETKGKLPCGALLVVGAVDGFDATKTWAREVFLELMMCFALNDGLIAALRIGELIHHIELHVRPLLFDDANPRRPVLACLGLPLYAICMAPVYPRTHPRYAPEPVVVVTWQADIALASTEPAFSRIRAAMKREHGSVYDADELMLPLPPHTEN